MRRTLCIKTETDGFSCAVVLDGAHVKTAAQERKSREHMAQIQVEPWYYEEFVGELVKAGWFMSEGAKLNFDHQRLQLARG